LRITHFIAQRLRNAPQKAFTTLVYRIGVISVAVGFSTTLVAFLIMQGFQQNVEQKLISFSGHLQVTHYAASPSYDAPPLDKRRLQGLPQTFPEAIQAMKAFAYKVVLLRTVAGVEGIVCKGLEPAVAHSQLDPYLVEGRLPRLDAQGYSQELLLSTQTARRLQLALGDEVIVCVVQDPPRYRKLKVVGLYATHMEDLDEKLAFCDLRLIQKLNHWPEHWVGGYEIFLHDGQLPETIATQLLEELDYDLSLATTSSTYAAVFDWLAILRKNAWIFMGLMLLVASSNLASIVLIQTMERTSMMGILKALGASDGQIRGVMLWSNLYMIGQGMLIGNLVGIGVCVVQRRFQCIPLDPTYYYISYVPIAWDGRILLGLNVLTFAVVVTVLLVAVAIIVRVKPTQAVRFR